MQKILPIIVTTREALAAAAAERCPVIYADEAFYRGQGAAIRAELGERGYVLSRKRGKKGVFFLLSQGEGRFDHTCQEISDPYGIL